MRNVLPRKYQSQNSNEEINKKREKSPVNIFSDSDLIVIKYKRTIRSMSGPN